MSEQRYIREPEPPITRAALAQKRREAEREAQKRAQLAKGRAQSKGEAKCQ